VTELVQIRISDMQESLSTSDKEHKEHKEHKERYYKVLLDIQGYRFMKAQCTSQCGLKLRDLHRTLYKLCLCATEIVLDVH
jgi:hypothetical protein